jgi:hypothetical protein
LVTAIDPPHVWHQVVVAADHPPGFDGIVNDHFLIRAPTSIPKASSPTTNSPQITSPLFDGGSSLRSPNTPDLALSFP